MKLSEIDERKLENDLYSCAQCGYCQDACAIYHEIPWESASPRGKLYWIKKILTKGILREDIEGDKDFVNRLYQCTLCGRCHEVCQTSLDTVAIWNAARAEVFKTGNRPDTLNFIAKQLEEVKNPYGMDEDTRLDWVDFTDMDEVPLEDEAEVAYFVGCTTSWKSANHDGAYATAMILNEIGEDWTFLGEDEWCCGGPLLMAGDEEKAQEFIKHNLKEIEKRNIKILITGCPSCYRMWRIEIPGLIDKDLSFEVRHITEHLYHRVKEGKLTLPKSEDKVTYHDPCELSRLVGVVDEPRVLLSQLSSKFVEMPEHGKDVRCCGGGGLLQATNNDLRLVIAKKRVDQAKSVGAKILTSACPACNMTFLDVVRETGDDLEVMDLMEYIGRQLDLI
ncbi:(Fe-S)-binding protein [Thermoproteota archaeon]